MGINRIIGRQHRIHYSTGNNEIMCGTKEWQCSDKNWQNVECKFCLRKRPLLVNGNEIKLSEMKKDQTILLNLGEGIIKQLEIYLIE
jgi:hypothetical protein